MGSIKEKIKYIKETKKLIREAIIAQGVDVPENTTFRDYANKVDSIKNTTHVSDNTTLASGTAVEKKIYYLSKTKENIKRAIVAAGVSVLETDTFRSYVDKIAQIKKIGGVKMANKITWADKVALQEKPDVVAENKVTAADMNQIKTAVNEAIDTMPSNLVNGKAKGSIRSIYAYDETGKLLGEYAQAFGENTIASGIHSHAEGSGATASSTNSHAEGGYTKASGYASHAEGSNSKALGEASHAEGNITTASGDCSHAEGLYTIASGENQHVQGKYNISDTTSAHIVGNGTERNIRSNAHTLDWQGNAWFAGDVYTGSTSGTNKDDGSVKLPVVYSGTTAPTNDIGKNGDLYVLLDS